MKRQSVNMFVYLFFNCIEKKMCFDFTVMLNSDCFDGANLTDFTLW